MNLQEIAASLNVSPAAVSIVRSGKPGVSALTRRRIQIALEENGYPFQEFRQPTPNAPPPPSEAQRYIQLLKFRRSSLLIDKNEGFVDAIIDAIDLRASSERYTLTLKSVSPEEYPAFLQSMDIGRCLGLLVIATEMERADICALSKLNMPLVILDSDHPDLPFSTVTMDNRGLAYRAVSHLLETGGGEVGYVTSAIRTGNFVGRANGYREALADHGRPWRAENVFTLTPSLQNAHADMRRLLSEGRRVPEALFAENDVLAIGAMRGLLEAGYRIPGDVRVIGVDNTPLSQIVSPTLSTMQISRSALGQQAFSALLRQTASPGGEPVHVRLSSRLILRESG
ncbi:MAG TPA: LacI family DNA-binding transcriptional regulator [Clostridia bacterium]|nr:LacI family DNA-binding transcriptional regulator [Clostridia bacterium]